MTTSHSRTAAQEVPGVAKLKVHKSRGAQPIENESGCKSGTIRQKFLGTGCAISAGTGIWVSGNSLQLEQEIRLETEDKHGDKCGTTMNVTEK